MHIYGIYNKIDGKVYVGKSLRRIGVREAEHFKSAIEGKKYCPYFYNAIRLHGKEAFEIVLFSGHAMSRDDLSAQENHYIAKHRTTDLQFGYNLTSGGDGADYWIGKKRSEADRQKMSLAKLGTKQEPETVFRRTRVHVGNKYNLGRVQSKEERNLRSLASPRPMLGKHHSEVTKGKISQSVSKAIVGDKNPFFGKKHSEESRQKMSAALKGRKSTEETLRKRSIALKGRKHTEETKKRMSDAAKNRKVPMSHIRLMVERRLAKKAGN